jgi:hypothetical protein
VDTGKPPSKRNFSYQIHVIFAASLGLSLSSSSQLELKPLCVCRHGCQANKPAGQSPLK